jgi:hypothetical protein
MNLILIIFTDIDEQSHTISGAGIKYSEEKEIKVSK